MFVRNNVKINNLKCNTQILFMFTTHIITYLTLKYFDKLIKNQLHLVCSVNIFKYSDNNSKFKNSSFHK